jgi:hypothetical protein
MLGEASDTANPPELGSPLAPIHRLAADLVETTSALPPPLCLALYQLARREPPPRLLPHPDLRAPELKMSSREERGCAAGTGYSRQRWRVGILPGQREGGRVESCHSPTLGRKRNRRTRDMELGREWDEEGDLSNLGVVYFLVRSDGYK